MFGKWFNSTYTGSMFGAGSHIFAVWGWIVANAGPKGILEINPKLLAAMIGEPEERIQEAIEYLMREDPSSRTKTDGGRRIVHEGGFQYRIVNHEVYREMRDEETRRAYNRQKQQESRARKAGPSGPFDTSNNVNDVKHCVPPSAAVSLSRRQKQKQKQKTEAEAKQVVVLSASEARTRRPPKPPPPEAIEVAQHLYNAIKSHKPNFKAGYDHARLERMLLGWADDVRLSMSADKVSADRLKAVIDFAHREPRGSFWRANIQSGAKLRLQVDKIESQAAEGSKAAANGAPDYSDIDLDGYVAACDAMTGNLP